MGIWDPPQKFRNTRAGRSGVATFWIPGSSDRQCGLIPPSLPRLALVAFVQSVGRRRLIARRSPTVESMAAIPEPIIAPTVTSLG
jgi:hypothetical protein